MTTDGTPFRESSLAKVYLLRGAIYREDRAVWTSLENHLKHIEDYFSSIGLELVYVPDEGYAFLRQMDVDDADLPVLIRRVRLPLEVTALGLVLRDELSERDAKFESEGLPTITAERIRERMDGLIPHSNDERRKDTLIERAIKGAANLGFLRKTETAETWEIMRIVKARFSLDVLEDLRARLQQHTRGEKPSGENDQDDSTDDA